MTRAVPFLTVSAFMLLALTACSDYYTSEDIENEGLHEESQQYDGEDWDAHQQEDMADEFAKGGDFDSTTGAGSYGWTCAYEPTMNDDWHDDAVCSNGSESIRPYLREWDDFITEDELMESAHEYAAQLNTG